MDKKIIVIDLDGTFVSVNTFHKWMKFLFVESLKNFNLVAIIQILKSAFLRYLKIIDHSQMKFSILKISETSIKQKQLLSFVQSLEPYVNKKIVKVLEDNTNISILATAAPLFYSQIIKEKYNFDYIIATPETSDTNWKENIRDEKRKNLFLLFEHNNLTKEITVLFTDHHDDLPLMKDSNLIYLVNPSNHTLAHIENNNITFKLL